jgi:hypothetical protein
VKPSHSYFFPLLLIFVLSGCLLKRIPSNVTGPLPDSERQERLAGVLKAHVETLSISIGQRSYLAPKGLEKAAAYIEENLRSFEKQPGNSVKIYSYKIPTFPTERRHRCIPLACTPELKSYDQVSAAIGGIDFKNIELEIRGTTHPEEVIVIGAHYDSDSCESGGCYPAADDNASGVAAIIELARMFQDHPQERTLRFVAFTNEEEPFFHTDTMGSLVYAKQSRRPGETVKAMFSLETVGYYSDKPGSQLVPLYLDHVFDLPTVGNFIGFIGDWGSSDLIRDSVASFQKSVTFPAEGVVTFSWVEGVDWSDHWSFRQVDVPSVMVTDSAPNRNLCYHKSCDTSDRLDYERMARVVIGLSGVLKSAGKSALRPREAR